MSIFWLLVCSSSSFWLRYPIYTYTIYHYVIKRFLCTIFSIPPRGQVLFFLGINRARASSSWNLLHYIFSCSPFHFSVFAAYVNFPIPAHSLLLFSLCICPLLSVPHIAHWLGIFPFPSQPTNIHLLCVFHIPCLVRRHILFHRPCFDLCF